MKSENKNFLLNIAYQFLSFLIPLITMPYISRVLGVDNVGIYAYTYSIANIYMLFGMLGINNYGNRAVAAARDNKVNVSKTFFSIYLLQLFINICALGGYICYLILFCNEYQDIALVQIISVISILFDINWFYFGLEKFKVTVCRNIIVKVSTLILVFLCVRTEKDLITYTLIMSGSTLISQLYLILIIHKYVEKQRVDIKEVILHFKDIVLLFIPVLSYSIYRVMDKVMLGKIANVTELGYYEYGEKLLNIPIAVITALGTVMLPRLSYILSRADMDYRKPILDSMKLAMKLATIMSFGIVLIADEAVIVLFGVEYAKSSEILKILSVTVLASAWANVIRTQFLIPLKKDKVYICSTFGAAALNFCLNFMLIQRYGAIGACIATVVAEFYIAIYQTLATKKDLEYTKYVKNFFIDALKALISIGFAYLLSLYVDNIVLKLFLKIMLAIVFFFLFNYNFFLDDFLGIKKRKLSIKK